MLKESEILELRDHLERAQEPLFYFDNDQDGLSSYLLLRRYFNKGNGVPVKTSPLGMEYFRRIDEFNPDYVFILDQPTVSQEFFEAVRERNIPFVWIDHHEIDKNIIPDYVHYYNPLFSDGGHEPVTTICYEITKKKEDLWLLIVGCISDKFFPEEKYKTFIEKYPDLSIDSKEPFEIFYNSEIGKIARMVGTGLKDRTNLVMKMIRFLINVKSPYEILEEKIENHNLHKRFNEIEFKFKKLISRAKEEFDGGPILFFRYSGATSMSADIANKLSYLFPEKIVVVTFTRGSRTNLSIRGKGVREIVAKAIVDISMATSGGHEDAVGAQMDEKDLDIFEKNLHDIIKD